MDASACDHNSRAPRLRRRTECSFESGDIVSVDIERRVSFGESTILRQPQRVVEAHYQGSEIASPEVDPDSWSRANRAVAKAVTGSHCNGFHFFKLNTTGGEE